ncbi:hypothetical protein KC332_g14420 [Hortaea werneckii]|nr:hypothetical protein KC358_g3414 [Hortaea werneckii]KAI6848177.1 hypothetical protein KC350_g3122 [Hortaea werneckii]KAI6906975.1 hypothetical protein KC348_g14431 [Hortaea werneckii]KAI6941508.1 hypothetical protein KC341_g2830 [Hortaea werneckii]KAI6978527.1 hypothetical protein KC321_g2843 [Hortaea werneckii]
MVPSTAFVLVGAILGKTLAQNCPAGSYNAGPLCCPNGYDYVRDSGKGGCCPPGYEFNGVRNECYQDSEDEEYWPQLVGQWFMVGKTPVKVVQGGFEVNGQLIEGAGEGVQIGNSLVTIIDGMVQVDGHRVSVQQTRPKPTPAAGSMKPGPDLPAGQQSSVRPTMQPKPSAPAMSSPLEQRTDECGCNKRQKCFDDNTLGVEYGKCYNIIDVNGLPLNQQVGHFSDRQYQSGGEIGNLIFRICKSTDDCSADIGTPVEPESDTFYIQDQFGWRGWKHGPGWMANACGAHFCVDHRPSYAVLFQGSGQCIYGEPAICLRDGAEGQGMGAPCPMGDPEKTHFGYTRNPNPCKAFRFIETQCMTDVGQTKP